MIQFLWKKLKKYLDNFFKMMYNAPVMKNVIENLLAEPAMRDWSVDYISENEATIMVKDDYEDDLGIVGVRFFRGSNNTRVKIYEKDYYFSADEMMLIGRTAQACSKL